MRLEIVPKQGGFLISAAPCDGGDAVTTTLDEVIEIVVERIKTHSWNEYI